MSKPILDASESSKSFILQTDASDLGFGIVLAQKDDKDNELPLLYLSKKFTLTVKRCSTAEEEKELATIFYGKKYLRI